MHCLPCKMLVAVATQTPAYPGIAGAYPMLTPCLPHAYPYKYGCKMLVGVAIQTLAHPWISGAYPMFTPCLPHAYLQVAKLFWGWWYLAHRKSIPS